MKGGRTPVTWAALLLVGNLGVGNETAVLEIVKALVVHGMIIQGSPMGLTPGPWPLENPMRAIETSASNLGKASPS